MGQQNFGEIKVSSKHHATYCSSRFLPSRLRNILSCNFSIQSLEQEMAGPQPDNDPVKQLMTFYFRLR
jgi:hypothetical protein